MEFTIFSKKTQKGAYLMDDQKEVRTKTPAIIVILLLILVFGIAYLCFSDFREKNSTEIIDSTRSVLLVQFAYGDDNPEYSDTTQVRNAMDSGGMIIIDVTDADSITESMGSLWQSYGASNADGYYYLYGAVLNYIASHGWNLVQGPSTGLSMIFYFSR